MRWWAGDLHGSTAGLLRTGWGDGRRRGGVDPRPATAQCPRRILRAGDARDALREYGWGPRVRHPGQEPPRRWGAVGTHRIHGPRARRRNAGHGDPGQRPGSVLGHGRRHGSDRHDHRGADPDAPDRIIAVARGHLARRGPRRSDRRDVRGGLHPSVLGGVGRHLGPGQETGPQRADGGGLRQRRRVAGEAAQQPSGLRPHVAADRPQGGARARPEPLECGGVQRDVVPQGAQAPGRRTADHRNVLPPARRGQRLELRLRQARFPAVPGDRARRPRGCPAPAARAVRRLAVPGVPGSAQALRP